MKSVNYLHDRKWPCSGVSSWLLGKSCKGHDVAPAYHFIKKEIITIHAHLTAYGLIPTKPAICLLGNGRIEIPLLVTFAKKLRVCNRVAILLAKLVLLTMLAFEMEDVNSECDITEERIISDSLSKGAVVIEENVIWLCARNTVGSLDHLLLVENTFQVVF
jgi:hypothetical protein